MGHIIVTGAGSGLGRALTIGLVERGHRVSMMGRRYQRLQEQEQLLGSAVIGIAADLAHHEEVDVAFAAAVEWGGLPDMVIHCAGVGEFGPVGVYTAEQIRRLAHDYGTPRPAAIRLHSGVQRAHGGANAVRAIASVPRVLCRRFFDSFTIGSPVFFSTMSVVKPPPWIMKLGITR